MNEAVQRYWKILDGFIFQEHAPALELVAALERDGLLDLVLVADVLVAQVDHRLNHVVPAVAAGDQVHAQDIVEGLVDQDLRTVAIRPFGILAHIARFELEARAVLHLIAQRLVDQAIVAIALLGRGQNQGVILARNAQRGIAVGQLNLHVIYQVSEIDIADLRGDRDPARVRDRHVEVRRFAALPLAKRARLLADKAHPIAILVLALAADQADLPCLRRVAGKCEGLVLLGPHAVLIGSLVVNLHLDVRDHAIAKAGEGARVDLQALEEIVLQVDHAHELLELLGAHTLEKRL